MVPSARMADPGAMDEQTALMDHGPEGGADSGTGSGTSFPPPQPPPQAAWYRIPVFRDQSDRKVGGVVSGLCRAYGFDLRTTRIAVTVAAIVLPLVFFAYLLAWIVLPEGAESAVPLEDVVRDRRRLPLLIAIGIVAVAVGLGSVGSWFVWGGFPWGVGLIALGVLLWVAPTLRPAPRQWSPPATDRPVPSDANTTATAPVASAPVPGGTFAGRPGVTVTADGTTLVPPARPTTPRRRRFPIGSLTVIAVFAFVGVAALGELLDWWNVEVLPVAVASVIALALGAALSTVVNRTWWLLGVVPPLVVASVGLLVTAPNLDGGTGERTVRPTLATVSLDEHLAMGQLTIDLRDLPSLDGVTVEAEVGYGRLHVLLPDDVTVIIHTEVNAGHAVLDGDELIDGLRQRDDRTVPAAGAPDDAEEQATVQLDLRIGGGEISIDRTPAGNPLAGTEVDV